MNQESTPTPSLPGRVLRLLLENPEPRSGQEMAGMLGVSRAAVSKAASALREAGFSLESRTRAGHLLIEEPEAPLPVRLEARLPPGSLGLPLYHYPEIDSTNLEARRRAEAGAPHGACFTAEHQTAGRGRLNRSWRAPAGGSLLFSLLLRPRLGLMQAFALNNAVSLAVCRGVAGLTGLPVKVKWPNDVYLENRKLAGVLTELTARGEMVDHAVVGVGLNVNLTPEDLEALGAPAASLLAATGRRWDRGLVLAAILTEATRLYRLLAGGRGEELAAEYTRLSLLPGREVEVLDGEASLVGRVSGFAPDGALILTLGDGREHLVRHGDVTLKRVEGIR